MGRVSDQLFKLRLDSGLTQAQTAQLLGISTKSVVAYESGNVPAPKEVTARWILEIGAIVRRARGVKTQGGASPRAKRVHPESRP